MRAVNCFNQGNDNITLVMKENGLEEGQIEGKGGNWEAGGMSQARDGDEGILDQVVTLGRRQCPQSVLYPEAAD